DGVNFIDEDDTGRFFPGLFEEVSYTACANTNKHFHEIRTTQAKERHLCFACNGLSKQSFTCTGRSDQQCSLRYFTTEIGVFLWVFEEVNDLHHFYFRFIQTGYITEVDIDFGSFIKKCCLGFAYIEDTARASATACSSAHFTHEKYPEPDKKQYGKKELKNTSKPVALTVNFEFGFCYGRVGFVKISHLVLKVISAGDLKGHVGSFFRYLSG